MNNFKLSLDLLELVDKVVELEDKHNKQLEQVVKKAGEDVRDIAKDNISKNQSYLTGALSNSITSKHNALKATVTVGKDYGVFVEEGTRAHIIKPKNKSFLRFYIGGNPVFAKKVNHPGTKAKPFLEPALKEVEESFISNIKEVLEK